MELLYVKPLLNTYADASSGTISNFRSSVFTYIHTLCIRTVKAPSRVCICTGSTEPSLFDNLISTNISCAGPLMSGHVVVDSLLIVLPLWDSVIALYFVVRYFESILVLQSSQWGRESWLVCVVCLHGVS